MGLCQTEHHKSSVPWSKVLSPGRKEGSLAVWSLHASSLISPIKAASALWKTGHQGGYSINLGFNSSLCGVEGTETTSKFTKALFTNRQRETLPPQLRNLHLTRYMSLTAVALHSILSSYGAFMWVNLKALLLWNTETEDKNGIF